MNDGESAVVNILGVDVTAGDLPSATATIAGWARRREGRRYVCVTGAHGLVEARTDAGFRAILNDAAMVTADGMPLVWVCRARGYRRAGRVYGPDLMASLCAAGGGLRHFFYGGGDGIAEELAARLSERYPGLEVAGTHTPPFRELTADEESEIASRIGAARPDIVWVGLGTPKQERWMARFRGRLDAPVLIGVGAAFDFHAGRKVQAPRWIQRSGLEWLFRLATEPRRLWRRYAKIVPVFGVLAVLQLAGLWQPPETRHARAGTPHR